MTKRQLVELLRALASDRAALARPTRQFRVNGEDLACYPIKDMNALLDRMNVWEELLLKLIDDGPIRPLGPAEPQEKGA